jgi:hypothetical protein
VFVGDFWDGASPAAAIVDYQVERAGMPLEHSVVHLVYLANGDAWYRVSGWDNTGVLVFNQPPYFLGQFTNESPVSVQKATLGGVKSKYR